MEITTAMIKELREKTGAGILDCKSALAEANGEPRGGREEPPEEGPRRRRQEGRPRRRRGARRLRLRRRRRRPRRAELRDRLRRQDGRVQGRPRRRSPPSSPSRPPSATPPTGNAEALRAMAAPATLPGATGTIADWLQAATAKTGENTQLRRFARIVAGRGERPRRSTPTRATRPSSSSRRRAATPSSAGDLAMQVAALTPLYAVREDVPGQGPRRRARDRQGQGRRRRQARGRRREDGRGDDRQVVRRGRPRRPAVRQGRQRRRSPRSSPSAPARTRRVVRFVRYKVGEGVEKKQTDLAAEVAALTK